MLLLLPEQASPWASQLGSKVVVRAWDRGGLQIFLQIEMLTQAYGWEATQHLLQRICRPWLAVGLPNGYSHGSLDAFQNSHFVLSTTKKKKKKIFIKHPGMYLKQQELSGEPCKKN